MHKCIYIDHIFALLCFWTSSSYFSDVSIELCVIFILKHCSKLFFSFQFIIFSCVVHGACFISKATVNKEVEVKCRTFLSFFLFLALPSRSNTLARSLSLSLSRHLILTLFSFASKRTRLKIFYVDTKRRIILHTND